MNPSTPAPSGATAPVPGADQAPRPNAAALQLLPGTGPKQLDLPISFAATRGCDRIRARLWADHRLKGLVLDVCLALSEFVDVRRKAWPKQTTLAKMVHASRQRVSMALSAAAKHAVLVKDRHRRGAGCQYTFLESWIAWFRTPGEASKEPARPPFRCHETRHLDVTKGDISGEPVQGNLISDRYAAAGTPRAREADRRRQEQQQQRNEDRIEGLFAAIAARAREAGHDYDERDERRRLAEGEIDVDALQRLADRLLEEVRERRLRRAHGPSYSRR